MRVLMITWEYPPFFTGGAGTVCRGMVGALLEKGIDILLMIPWIHMGIFNPAKEADIRRLEALFTGAGPETVVPYGGIDLYDDGPNTRVSSLVRFPFISLPLETDFDIIHCHDWPTIPAALQEKDRTGKPLIIHFHSVESDRNPGNPNREIRDIEASGCRRADLILTVSKYTAQKLQDEYGADPGKIRVLYNGFYLEKSEGAGTDFNPGGKTVLFLGRLTPQKKPEVFLEASLSLAGARKDAVFVMAGSGPLEAELRERVLAAGAADRVKFTGFIPSGDITALLDSADILVMPSLSEPFGVVGLEAMSRGVAVIVTRTAGLTEVVNSVIALDHPAADDLAALIATLLDNPDELKRIGVAAAKEAGSHDWSGRSSELTDIYRDLLSMPR